MAEDPGRAWAGDLRMGDRNETEWPRSIPKIVSGNLDLSLLVVPEVGVDQPDRGGTRLMLIPIHLHLQPELAVVTHGASVDPPLAESDTTGQGIAEGLPAEVDEALVASTRGSAPIVPGSADDHPLPEGGQIDPRLPPSQANTRSAVLVEVAAHQIQIRAERKEGIDDPGSRRVQEDSTTQVLRGFEVPPMEGEIPFDVVEVNAAVQETPGHRLPLVPGPSDTRPTVQE